MCLPEREALPKGPRPAALGAPPEVNVPQQPQHPKAETYEHSLVVHLGTFLMSNC